MSIRHIIFAALLASASIAQAGIVPITTTTAMPAGWTMSAGSVNVMGAVDAMQMMVASGKGAGSWTKHTELTGGTGVLYSFTTLTASGSVSSALGGGGGGGGNPTGPFNPGGPIGDVGGPSNDQDLEQPLQVAIPLPGTIALMLAGLAGIGLMKRRRA